MNLYPLEEYSEDFALKVNIATKLTLFFLLKSAIILLAGLYLQTQKIDLIHPIYGNSRLFTLSLIASIPAIIVFITLMRRTPTAGNITRKIWRQGRALLSLSVIAMTLCDIYTVTILHTPTQLHLIQVIIDMYCCYYVFTSNRFKETFNSFPAAS